MALSDFVLGNVINMKPHGEFIHSLFIKILLHTRYYYCEQWVHILWTEFQLPFSYHRQLNKLVLNVHSLLLSSDSQTRQQLFKNEETRYKECRKYEKNRYIREITALKYNFSRLALAHFSLHGNISISFHTC